MTVKEQLMPLGMKEDDFDTYYRVTPISREWVANFKHNHLVTMFRDQIEHKLWYNLPFGNWEDYMASRK